MKRDETPVLKETRTLFETPYINIYDLVYEDRLHYYDASRRKPRFLLFREYRYPVGHYVLSIPSGLIDEKDRQDASPILSAMRRELAEETGINNKNAVKKQQTNIKNAVKTDRVFDIVY